MIEISCSVNRKKCLLLLFLNVIFQNKEKSRVFSSDEFAKTCFYYEPAECGWFGGSEVKNRERNKMEHDCNSLLPNSVFNF